MKDPQMPNSGPHDPELAELIIEEIQNTTDGRPYIEVRDILDETDWLNNIIDGINDIFSKDPGKDEFA